MKKLLKWGGIALLSPFLLFIILAAILYITPVQDYVAKRVAAYASEQTGMDISVGRVRLRFPLDLSIDDFRMLRANDSIPNLTDTIADMKSLDVDIEFLPLLKKQVNIDRLTLNDTKINTDGLIPDTRVKGTIGELSLQSKGIDLKNESLKVNMAKLKDADLDIALADTVPPDTTTTENNWKIFLDSLDVTNSKCKVHLPNDTIHVAAEIGQLSASSGSFDLNKSNYKLHQLKVKDTSVRYDNKYEKPTDGLDVNHVSISDLNLSAESFVYDDPDIDVRITSCSFKEKSGIEVKELSGDVAVNSEGVHIPNLHLTTPDSRIDTNFSLNNNNGQQNGKFNIHSELDCTIGKQDIMRFMGSMPADFRKNWPSSPLSISGTIVGNDERISFSGLNINLPTAIRANANGWIENPADPKKMKADINLSAKTGNLKFVTSLLDRDTRKNINVPNNISIDGNIKANGSHYVADMNIAESKGRINAKVDFNAATERYDADIKANNFAVNHFVKNINAGAFTGKIKAKGNGFDIMSPKTQLKADAQIEKFTFEGYDLSGTKANANIQNGRIKANVKGNNPLFDGDVELHALTNSKLFKGTIVGDIEKIDLKKLHITDDFIVPSGCVHIDLTTDFKDYYEVSGSIGDLQIKTNEETFRPDDVVIDLLSRRDTTHAVINSSDFQLSLDGKGGYKQLLSQSEKLSKELSSQLKNRKLDQAELWKNLPEMKLKVKTGNKNFATHLLNRNGYDLSSGTIDLSSSPNTGLNGFIAIDSLVADSMRIDKINVNMKTENGIFTYTANAQNKAPHPQYVFNALVEGSLSETGSDINAKLYDKDNKLGLDIGLTASIEQNGMSLHLKDNNPIIGYKTFAANKDNYIYLSDDKRVAANLQLLSEDGMGLQLYTNDENTDALQDITLSIHKLELEPITKALPYMPNITGTVNGDYHIIQTRENLSVSTAMTVDKMHFEGNAMGDIGTEFVYMPLDDGTHFIDGQLLQNDREVGTIVGKYNSKNETIDATFNMARMPLSLINGFIPDKIIGLEGYSEGQLSIKGQLNKPDVNGEIYLDSCFVYSSPYGVKMRFADDPIRIVGSNLLFENFEMFAYNNQPLNISGFADFSNLDKIKLDLRMRARDFELINSKENPRSETFGKAFVNFFATIKGTLDNMKMRGRLDVLGATDMTYILRDSPLTTDNRLNELVTFVDFNDTTATSVNRPPLNGLNMDININIDENAHIKCDLNSDHSNYIDLMGGGDLRMQYNNIDNLRLTGKYTLANGEMKYSLPIIPLKTFTIQDGSYIEFVGDAMNPRLNITATERMKATVGSEGSAVRSVDFDCGVIITKTLNDMGLEFIVDAPEDIAIRNELSTMSKEERGKIAVTMLTTGMYLADGNTSGFTMNGALSSFLQNEINNLTGSALRTLDLSFGIDNATDAAGNLHTDYSFKFAKRFWNNRLRIVVGGKLSSGPDVAGQNQSFFDNVTFEYRLNENANKYLKLFYNRNSYDWIEGNVGEYGAGFLWRRKVQHFKDFFNFKSDNRRYGAPVIRRDSLNKDTIKSR